MAGTSKQTSYEATPDGGVVVRDLRQLTKGTIVPNYVVDLYLPIIGYDGLGILTMLYRLAGNDFVDVKVYIRKYARAGKMGFDSFSDRLDLLAECGIVRVIKPEGMARLKHHRTQIELLDPPINVPEQYGGVVKERAITQWLIRRPDTEVPDRTSVPEVPDRTSESPEQDSVGVLSGTSMVCTIPYVPSGDGLAQTADAADAPPRIAVMSEEATRPSAAQPALFSVETARYTHAAPIVAENGAQRATGATRRRAGSADSALKNTKPLSGTHALVAAFQVACQHPEPNDPAYVVPYSIEHAKEARAAKQLVDEGWSNEQVIACYYWLRSSTNYDGTLQYAKHISLATVRKNIGAWATQDLAQSRKKQRQPDYEPPALIKRDYDR